MTFIWVWHGMRWGGWAAKTFSWVWLGMGWGAMTFVCNSRRFVARVGWGWAGAQCFSFGFGLAWGGVGRSDIHLQLTQVRC